MLKLALALSPTLVPPAKASTNGRLVPLGIAVPLIVTLLALRTWLLVGLLMAMVGTGLPTNSKSKLMSELLAAFWWISTATTLFPVTRDDGLSTVGKKEPPSSGA